MVSTVGPELTNQRTPTTPPHDSGHAPSQVSQSPQKKKTERRERRRNNKITMVCGGYYCTKNCLSALNVLYVVSTDF